MLNFFDIQDLLGVYLDLFLGAASNYDPLDKNFSQFMSFPIVYEEVSKAIIVQLTYQKA